jgi:hypothetical protein
MKKRVLIFSFLFSVSFSCLLAQNKTLGVGTPTPNPNAALHVESPSANQGFIMPRLTTAQRNAMASILAATDKGLMLFDTDLNTIYFWDGAAWKTSAQVAGGPKLSYPYADTVVAPTGTVDLFAIRYFAPENKRVFRIENNNPTNGSSTLSVANGGTGAAGFFNNSNVATTSSTIYSTIASNAGGALAPVAVYGESTGTGSLGGAFWNQNAANNFPALYAKTLGVGSSIFAETSTGNASITGKTDGPGNAGYFETTGAGNAGKFIVNNINSANPAVWAESNSNVALSTPVYGLMRGTGDAAGVFRVNNAGSTQSGVFAETNGSGPALFAQNLGTGRAGQFQITNAGNAETAIRAFTSGTGRAGFFTVNNAGNTADGIFTTTNGSGAGLSSLNSGTGRAGYFEVNNAASTAPAVTVKTNVTGTINGFESFHTGTGDAIFANAAAGSAGNFQNSNSSSPYSTLFALTNSVGGHALGVNNTAQGNAISVFGGGLKISTAIVNSATINKRAMAYLITTGGTTFSFSIPGYTFSDGDTFFAVNDTLSAITLETIPLAVGEGKTFVYFGGVGFRAF